MIDTETTSIAKAGAILLTFFIVVFICYVFLSMPINTLFDAFDDADTGAAEGAYNWITPIVRSAFNLFFAGMAAVPVTWFIVWVFSREPEWRYERRL